MYVFIASGCTEGLHFSAFSLVMPLVCVYLFNAFMYMYICKCKLSFFVILLPTVIVFCLQCRECTSTGGEGWNSQLMACDIKSRNATIRWSPDSSNEMATYVVKTEKQGHLLHPFDLVL